MYDNILAAINDQDWKRAVRELNDVVKNSDFNEKIAILAATIFNHIGDSKTAYNMICKGLLIDSRNCELWLMLGQTYELQNPDQAYLCYENALFYSNDESDKELINSYIKNLMESAILTVKKSSIVILSYNSLEFTKECIASIEKTCPESAYEIVIVDNHSEDGSVEWLKRKSGIKLVTNDKNMGFPKGCNQGIEISERENDIFLLNNDTILCENSLFWLRMGLYESENVGATGSVSNYVSNGQMSSISESTIERMIEKGRLNNAIVNVPVVEKMYLVGFAVLIRRSALEKIGYLDERFTPGTYEDNDLGLRLKANGYSVRLCRNSFIFHYGSGNGKNLNKWNGLYAINNRKIDEKWHFDTKKVMYPDLSVVEQVISRKRDKLKVLEIGCELGATLIEIKNKVPDVEVFGIENDDSLFKVTNKYIDCNQIKDLTKELPYPEAYFDYIIAKSIKGDLKYLAGVYSNLRRYLAKDGEIISPMYSLVELSHHVEIKPSINIDYYSGSDNYSDGDVEDEIINILLNNATEHYDEAIYENYSWPTYYHLSGIRKNILNWYPFKEGADALEIGCGMGAITSVLCDKCKTVTSVELSLRRATATLVRCRHRDNLQVIVGNLNDIEFPKKYDYITLIGVLEYQGKYTDGDNPYKDFIVKIKQLLKPNGKLLVAIENQYGLKYWCGAFEDHTGTPFNGINQYIYSGRGVKTFSRNGLEQLLKESGFNNTFFYYPMPDYKFPEKVFSDEYLPKEGDLAALKYYYLNTSGVVADESKLYDDIISNGVFKFFANSFLVECSDDSHLGEVIFSSSPIIRKREYAVQTNISRTSDGKWVEKVALFPEATPFLDQIIENERFLKGNGRSVISSERTNKGIKQKFIAGDSLDGRLVRLYMEKEKSSILDLWDLIYKSISAKIIDTVPKNAIIENNNITWFDQEWREENSDIDYVMFRALLVFYVAHPFAENIVSINELYERYNILCKKDMFLCREKELYRTIFDATLLVETDYFCPSGINNIITDNLKKLMSSHTTAIAKEAEKDINKDDLYDKIKKRLYTPTYFEKIDGLYFIVDCWHNRVIYSNELNPISEWETLDNNLHHPHSICKVKDYYLIEDTENNKIVVYCKKDECFIKVSEIGVNGRPHRIINSLNTDEALCLLSTTQQILIISFTNEEIKTRLCKIDEKNTYPYIRSMRMIDKKLFCATATGVLLVLNPSDGYNVEKRIILPKGYYSLNDVICYSDLYFISVYGDEKGERKPGVLICDKLESGEVHEVTNSLGVFGVPYFFSVVDGSLIIPEIDNYNRICSYKIVSGKFEQRVLYDFGAPSQEDKAFNNE